MLFQKSNFHKDGLRVEQSMQRSGVVFNENTIPVLPGDNYCVISAGLKPLDGDAPKQFIKAYFYGDKHSVKKNRPSTWCGYLAKTAEKWYPVESVTEYMINRVGQVLGVDMNEVRLVKANTQIRFLSRYFLSKDERLVHGAEICGEYLEDMELARQIANDKKTARSLFTFQFIESAIHTVYPNHAAPLINALVKMIVFDAIVGNNDRHFYNWGIIDNVRKSGKPPTFAPVYDSARGLLWNESDANVAKQLFDTASGGKKIANYIEKALPRISIEDNSQINHFELVAFLTGREQRFREIAEQLTTATQEQTVLQMLKKECFGWLVIERQQVITMILQERFAKLRRLI